MNKDNKLIYEAYEEGLKGIVKEDIWWISSRLADVGMWGNREEIKEYTIIDNVQPHLTQGTQVEYLRERPSFAGGRSITYHTIRSYGPDGTDTFDFETDDLERFIDFSSSGRARAALKGLR